MQIRRLAAYIGGGVAFAALASAVAIGAVAPVAVRPHPPEAASAAPPSPRAAPAPARHAQRAAAAPRSAAGSFTPSEEVSADKPVSFPADI